MKNKEISSFRDPSGYIYYENNCVIRKINKEYFKQYDNLMKSGLYEELTNNNYLIKHEEIERNKEYILLKVTKIPFISYPYEWSFDELKDAALLTLKIQDIALKYNMILKDASNYNIQFYKGKVIFIDTLSFDFYKEGLPWGAYGQFCRHFISPLLLNTYVDERCSLMLKNHIDGLPIDLTNNILKNRGGFTAKQHIKWHAKSIIKNNEKVLNTKNIKISKQNLINMNNMMINQITNLTRKKIETEWDTYYQVTNYDEISDQDKIKLVNEYISKINFKEDDLIYDLGANDGKYSRIASKYCDNIISFDIDNNCVNRNYLLNKKESENKILPLILDFNNPSSSIGFASKERKGITERAKAKCIMALALIHHISISNNVPFSEISSWLSELGDYLIIEFVPKEDSQVQKLLKTRRDIFSNYNQENFEKTFSENYKIITKTKIKNSQRILYMMKVK